MNILIVPSWYESDDNKILGSFIKEQATALARAGHIVIVGYVYMRPFRELRLSNMYKIKENNSEGIREYIFSVPSYASKPRGTWLERNRKFYSKLLDRICKDIPIDIIHVHTFEPAGYAIAALKEKIDVPIVYTEHYSKILEDNLDARKKRALDYTLSRVDCALAVSNSLKEKMENYSNKEISVLPNILSPLFEFREREKKSEEPFSFLSVGGLIYSKRHNLSIRAFHEAFAEDENVMLTILGEGTERENLQNLINELGEQRRIHLLGRKTREETAKFMNEADAFVLPSAVETFGVVYIEAMASGLPVIGTRNGGFNDIYFDGCGEIIDVDNIDQLTAALRKVYTYTEQYDRCMLAQKSQQCYGEKAIVSQLENIYGLMFQMRENNSDVR